MRYLVLIYDEQTANPSPEPPDPAVWGPVMEEYNAYSQMLRDTARMSRARRCSRSRPRPPSASGTARR